MPSNKSLFALIAISAIVLILVTDTIVYKISEDRKRVGFGINGNTYAAVMIRPL